MSRNHKKWLVVGKPYVCYHCGWVLKQAASNTDKRRGIVCECSEIPMIMPR